VLQQQVTMAENAAVSSKCYKYSDEMPDLKKHNNHMSNTLKANPGMYEKMACLTTPAGYTFDMAIQTGVDNAAHPYIVTVGATAGDEETYTTWKPFFDEVIARRHNDFPADGKQPTNMNADDLKFEGFDTEYVLSSRVRTGRSIRGICMPPFSTRAERREVERIIVEATSKLGEQIPELKGAYEGLKDMTDERHEQLIDEHLMFDKPVSPLLLSGGMARDWPDGRGVYLNETKNFIVWANEEDHMRIVSMQMDGDMKAVFTRFCTATNQIEKNMKEMGKEYMHNDHLGYVLACPSNLGTGIRAGCHVKLPTISEDARFGDILLKLRLQKRGVGGVDTASKGGVFDISNLDRLGFSEVQLVQMVCDGITLLVKMEKKLAAGESIDDLMPEPINVPWK
jgi:creatine kinase